MQEGLSQFMANVSWVPIISPAIPLDERSILGISRCRKELFYVNLKIAVDKVYIRGLAWVAVLLVAFRLFFMSHLIQTLQVFRNGGYWRSAVPDLTVLVVVASVCLYQIYQLIPAEPGTAPGRTAGPYAACFLLALAAEFVSLHPPEAVVADAFDFRFFILTVCFLSVVIIAGAAYCAIRRGFSYFSVVCHGIGVLCLAQSNLFIYTTMPGDNLVSMKLAILSSMYLYVAGVILGLLFLILYRLQEKKR
jgi:hypothetical protein